jgi:hypothetical protein
MMLCGLNQLGIFRKRSEFGLSAMKQAAARIGITELNELLLEIEGIGYKIFVHKRASFTLIRRAKEVFHGKSSQDLSRQFPRDIS